MSTYASVWEYYGEQTLLLTCMKQALSALDDNISRQSQCDKTRQMHISEARTGSSTDLGLH